MPFVRADVANVLNMLAAQPGPKMEEGDAATARAAMKMLGQMVERPRGELAHARDFTIAGADGFAIPARAYSDNESPGAGPVMVFFHGGGWVIGDIEVYDSLCAEIARVLKITVVSVGYRLAPEARFPTAVDDCIAATRWIAETPLSIGHAVSGIIPAGDSAGGNLAAVVSQELHGKMAVPIIAQWLIYPGVDMTADGGSMAEFADGYLLTAGTMAWFMDHYLHGADPTHPRASPIYADLVGQPPTLVYTCSLDPLRDQGRAYAGKMIAAGVRTIFREAEGQIHGSMTLRGAIPSAQDDLHANLQDLRLLLDEAITAA